MSTVKTNVINGRTFQNGMTLFTSESVTEGHPDKVCDYIADSILDAYLEKDPCSRVACEVLCKGDTVVLAGEITSCGKVDYEKIVRQTVQEIGYVDDTEPFCADTLLVMEMMTNQAQEIAQGVDTCTSLSGEQGAGDQGMMFGYATDETPELMPLPILLAHSLSRGLAEDRRNGNLHGLRPDGKTQVTVLYENSTPKAVTDILVSTQHSPDIDRDTILSYVKERLAPRILRGWFNSDVRVNVNPTGSFVQGGPATDCGLTGRKIIVDTYGGMARHGGGCFSGKDPSKVDRSAAYFCRFVARQLVKEGIGKRAEIQVAYAIGVAKPVSKKVDTFGTGDEQAAIDFVNKFDFRPEAIIERLDLLRPIYRQTTNYGHFGKAGLPWED
jgi:S-adenosylmethionine synthetase